MKKRILSINGNWSMNYLLQTVLSGTYYLITVSDVFEGIHELKREKRIDLIIVDIDYEQKENLDFIQHIRTSSLYNVPVIALMSKLTETLIEKLITANVYDYFLKPFNPLDLLKTIEELTLLPSAS